MAIIGIAVAVGGLYRIFTDDPLPPSGPEIERSLDAEIGREDRELAVCHREARVWRCQAGPASYRVTVDRERCWSAERVGRRGRRFPKTLEGCVDDVPDDPTPLERYD